MISGSGLAYGPFTLANLGDSFTTAVLTIGTPETSVNLFEDTTPRQVSVDFAFLNPLDATGALVTGSTTGFIIPFTSCGILAGGCGAVDWSNTPTIFNFGTGGIVLAAPPGRDIRNAGKCTRERHLHLCEPVGSGTSTWAMMLLGFGAVGFAIRRRRSPKLAQVGVTSRRNFLPLVSCGLAAVLHCSAASSPWGPSSLTTPRDRRAPTRS